MQTKAFISLTGGTVILSLSSPAYAYIDPATGSIILQAAIGAVAGATLFLRTSLFKFKALFSRKKSSADE